MFQAWHSTGMFRTGAIVYSMGTQLPCKPFNWFPIAVGSPLTLIPVFQELLSLVLQGPCFLILVHHTQPSSTGFMGSNSADDRVGLRLLHANDALLREKIPHCICELELPMFIKMENSKKVYNDSLPFYGSIDQYGSMFVIPIIQGDHGHNPE